MKTQSQNFLCNLKIDFNIIKLKIVDFDLLIIVGTHFFHLTKIKVMPAIKLMISISTFCYSYSVSFFGCIRTDI